MDSIVLESVSKVFRHRPALSNWLGKERSGETHALRNVTLRLPAGKIMVLLGPNGSGKTTTLKLIATVLLPDAGRVLVGGTDTRHGAARVRRMVGFSVASERSFFPRLSARENLDFFAVMDNVPRRERAEQVETMLDRTGLSGAADILVMKFSTGMYQRLAIARALIKQPSVVLLDEPTRSLDPAAASHFWGLVRELPIYGATVLVATHSFQEASAIGDSIAVLKQGELAGKAPIGARSAEELRSFYFRTTGELDESAEMLPRGLQ